MRATALLSPSLAAAAPAPAMPVYRSFGRWPVACGARFQDQRGGSTPGDWPTLHRTRRAPTGADGEVALPDPERRRSRALHHAMLAVVQAYIRHAEFRPGGYVVPRMHGRRRSIPSADP